MAQASPETNRREPHDEAELLLPWYAMGQLDEADRARFENHLYSCASCRQQLAGERRFASEFQALNPELESGWARLLARIEAEPPRESATPGPLREIWALLARPAVASLAAAQVAFLVFAGGVLLWLAQPAYHTLGSAAPPAGANVIVMFSQDASEDDIRNALEAADASIVGGPTSADAYLLHVAPKERQAAIARLKANDNVEMAEPIDGESS